MDKDESSSPAIKDDAQPDARTSQDSPGSGLERAVAIARATHRRVGRPLDHDAVNRISSRLGLELHTCVELMARLEAEGVTEEITRPRAAGDGEDAAEGSELLTLPSTGLEAPVLPGLPLLTRDEEYALARRIRQGQEAQALNPGELLPEERDKLIWQGTDARNALIERNVRLITWYVTQNRSLVADLEDADLIQAGVLGLIRAAEKFDPEFGARFSTYAVHWIRQSITRMVHDQGRTIRLPDNAIKELTEIRRARRRMVAKCAGVEPDAGMLAKETGIDLGKILTLLSVEGDVRPLPTRRQGETVEKYVPLGSSAEPDPYDVVSSEEIRKLVRDAVDTLSEREREVLVGRFGLGLQSRLTLDELGARLDLTRERVRQIQCQAASRLEWKLSSTMRTLEDSSDPMAGVDAPASAQPDEPTPVHDGLDPREDGTESTTTA